MIHLQANRMMWAGDDIKFMRRALALARKGLGATRPNPAVGAVVVRDGRIVGEGWHMKAGTPHAEVHALNAAGIRAQNATIYVTLEPCNHTGRTPPCTRAILKAGISRVVVGTADPNPRVDGGGIGFLRSRGLSVKSGCLEYECRKIIAPFAKHLTTGLPWIISKVAMSLDGRTATRTGHSQWITNRRSRVYGHRMRHICDAILVGKGTVLADDPSLTCRLPRGTARDPLRVILDSSLSSPLDSKVVKESSVSMEEWIRSADNPHAPTLLVGVRGEASADRMRRFEAAGASILLLPADGSSGGIDLRALLSSLGDMGIQSILVEGGATVHGSFWDQRLVDEALFFYAPMVIGGLDARPGIGGMGAGTLDHACRLHHVKRQALGDNLLIQGMISDLNALWKKQRH